MSSNPRVQPPTLRRDGNRLSVLTASGQKTAGAPSVGGTRQVQLNLICKDDLTLHREVNVLRLHRMPGGGLISCGTELMV